MTFFATWVCCIADPNITCAILRRYLKILSTVCFIYLNWSEIMSHFSEVSFILGKINIRFVIKFMVSKSCTQMLAISVF